MNKYQSEMEKIMVSPEMKERILKNVLKETKSNQITSNQATPKQVFHKWIKPMSAMAACCIIAVTIMIAHPVLVSNNQEQSGVQIANPIVVTDGINELKKAVPFDVLVPAHLPEGYKIEETCVISGDLAQIIYINGSNTITYRMAKGADEISGDYTEYEVSDTLNMGEAEVTLKGSATLVNLATWTLDDYSYALSFSQGIEKEAVLSIIESIGKV